MSKPDRIAFSPDKIDRRAFRAYVRRFGADAAVPSNVTTHYERDGKQFVELGNVNGPLATYRVITGKDDGFRLAFWPVGTATNSEFGSPAPEQAAQQPPDADDQMVRPEPFDDDADLDEHPIEEWTAEELTCHVVKLVEEIHDYETGLTWSHFRLGETLTCLRGKYGQGEWLPYLKTLGINKTRWEKAKAIYETLKDDPSRCDDLTLAQAYELRKRKQRQNHSGSPKRQRAAARRKSAAPLPKTPPQPNGDDVSGDVNAGGEAATGSSGSGDILPLPITTEGEAVDQAVAAGAVAGRILDSEVDDLTPDELEALVDFARSVLIEDETNGAVLSYWEAFDCDGERAESVLEAAIAQLQDVFAAPKLTKYGDDYEVVRKIIERAIEQSQENRVFKCYVIERTKCLILPCRLHNKAIEKRCDTNDGPENIRRGAEKMFLDAMRVYKDRFIVRKDGWIYLR